jgi:hypothetical protein
VLDAGAEAVFWAKAKLAQSTALAITTKSFVRFIVGSPPAAFIHKNTKANGVVAALKVKIHQANVKVVSM